MSVSNFDLARANMVEQQVRPWDVLESNVLDTLAAIKRDAFVPSAYQNIAYADTSIPLNDNASMMHPVVEGRLIQALDIQPRDEILEIGTGSGYITACLAHMGAHVDSYEIDAELAAKAEETLHNQYIYNVNIIAADGVVDFTTRKTYNAIAITGSMAEVSDAHKHALAVGGRLFVISGDAPAMSAHIITRTSQDTWSDKVLFETVIAPLQHAQKAEVFAF